MRRIFIEFFDKAQHHPDKLVGKGLPEEMKKMANEKTQEIISAYELIKKHRGMR